MKFFESRIEHPRVGRPLPDIDRDRHAHDLDRSSGSRSTHPMCACCSAVSSDWAYESLV